MDSKDTVWQGWKGLAGSEPVSALAAPCAAASAEETLSTSRGATAMETGRAVRRPALGPMDGGVGTTATAAMPRVLGVVGALGPMRRLLLADVCERKLQHARAASGVSGAEYGPIMA